MSAKRNMPTRDGFFGEFGGKFVPETLMAPLAELEAGYRAARRDRAFRQQLDDLLRDYVGRPTPLTEAARFAAGCGEFRLFLKREDLNHTGAHKINNALGQALLAKRMGKGRVIAETGAGQHGVATATACALLGLECRVYMGEVDMARQELERLPDAPSRRGGGERRERKPDPEGRDQRGDPRLGHQRREHALHHRLGPRPASLSDDRARLPVGDREGGRGADPEADGEAPGRRHRVRGRRVELDRPLSRDARARGREAHRRRGGREEPRARRACGAVRGRVARRAARDALDPASGRRGTDRRRRTRSRQASTIRRSGRSTRIWAARDESS